MHAISTALAGLHRAEQVLGQTAAQMARKRSAASARHDEISLSDEAVALLHAQNSDHASRDAIKVAEEMQKSTLSLVA